MLEVVAYLLLVSVSTFAAGFAVWKGLHFLLYKNEPAPPPATAELCLFGMGAQVLMASWWVLACPLSSTAAGAIMVLPLSVFLSAKTRTLAAQRLRIPTGLSPILAAAFAFYAIGLLLKAAGPTEIFDDGIAHLPVIAGMKQAGTVIGLANLHPNFGYNTHSTLAQGLYSLEWLFGRPLYSFNAWLALVCGWLLFSKIAYRGSAVSALELGFALLPFFVLRSQITGLSTDPGHYLLAWTILGQWAADGKQHGRTAALHGFLWFGLMAAVAITFKINALPLGILSLAWMWNRRRSTGLLSFTLGAMALTLAPWLVRNVLLTGYLFMLAPQTAMPFADWRVPAGVLARLTEQVSGEVFHTGERFAFGYWKLWASAAGTTNTALLAMAVFGLGALGVLSRQTQKAWPILLTLIAGLALWFLTVTEPRYAHAWIMPAAMVTVGYLATAGGLMAFRQGQQGFYMLLIALAFLNLAKSFREFGLWPHVVLAQAPRPEAVWDTCNMDGRAVYLPLRFKTRPGDRMRIAPGRAYEVENNLCGCWNTPFPCVYRPEDLQHLEWRGATLREGFRYRRDAL